MLAMDTIAANPEPLKFYTFDELVEFGAIVRGSVGQVLANNSLTVTQDRSHAAYVYGQKQYRGQKTEKRALVQPVTVRIAENKNGFTRKPWEKTYRPVQIKCKVCELLAFRRSTIRSPKQTEVRLITSPRTAFTVCKHFAGESNDKGCKRLGEKEKQEHPSSQAVITQDKRGQGDQILHTDQGTLCKPHMQRNSTSNTRTISSSTEQSNTKFSSPSSIKRQSHNNSNNLPNKYSPKTRTSQSPSTNYKAPSSTHGFRSGSNNQQRKLDSYSRVSTFSPSKNKVDEKFNSLSNMTISDPITNTSISGQNTTEEISEKEQHSRVYKQKIAEPRSSKSRHITRPQRQNKILSANSVNENLKTKCLNDNQSGDNIISISKVKKSGQQEIASTISATPITDQLEYTTSKSKQRLTDESLDKISKPFKLCNKSVDKSPPLRRPRDVDDVVNPCEMRITCREDGAEATRPNVEISDKLEHSAARAGRSSADENSNKAFKPFNTSHKTCSKSSSFSSIEEYMKSSRSRMINSVKCSIFQRALAKYGISERSGGNPLQEPNLEDLSGIQNELRRLDLNLKSMEVELKALRQKSCYIRGGLGLLRSASDALDGRQKEGTQMVS